MSEDVYRNLANSDLGYIIAPAGFGKTETIVRSVKNYCTGKQLILTHTHAGVREIKKRLIKQQVETTKYHIETISGWALSWVSKYPQLANYKGNLPTPNNKEWVQVYEAANLLLNKSFIKKVIKNSYTGVIVDEYQDCTESMHKLVISFKNILPCRVLGDPLQGIFDLETKDPLITWQMVQNDFQNKIGELSNPYRWINNNNLKLGEWLKSIRSEIEQNKKLNYTTSPVVIKKINAKHTNSEIQKLCRRLNGSVCFIGPKHGNYSGALLTSLVNIGFFCVEPNDLGNLNKFITELHQYTNRSELAKKSFDFIKKTFTGLGSNTSFIEKVLLGTLQKKPKDIHRQRIFDKYQNEEFSFCLLLDVIKYITSQGIKCRKYDSIVYLKKILEQHIETKKDLPTLFSDEIKKRKHIAKKIPNRCIGSTLLLKGLEFENAVILHDSNWGSKDLYVALTRGCKSVYVVQATA